MREIPLTQNQIALVDDSDYEFLSQWSWYAKNHHSGNFYAVRSSPTRNGKHYAIFMHRQILGLKHGDKRQGDHINHNTLDNCQDNLRICTNRENHRNQKSQRNSTSRFKGVYWNKINKKWVAQITVNGLGKYLGIFKGEEEAALVYDKAAVSEFGEFAHLNFPTFQRSLVC